MFLEGFLSIFGGDISGVGFLADELFFNHDIILGFQGFCMAGKVSIRYTKKFFEHVEVGTFVHHQDRHDAQSDTMVESFVDILDDVFQKANLIL